MVALGRVVCSSALLLVIALVKKDRLRLDSKKDVFLIILTGAVMAAHWTTFFQSIQVSTVAIGTITFSTFPLFLTFLEPVVFHEKIRRQSIISAVCHPQFFYCLLQRPRLQGCPVIMGTVKCDHSRFHPNSPSSITGSFPPCCPSRISSRIPST